MSDREALQEVVQQVLADAWPPLPEYGSQRSLPPVPGRLLSLAEELGWGDLEEDADGFTFTATVLEQLGSVLGPGELVTNLTVGPMLSTVAQGGIGSDRFAVSWTAPVWRRDADAPVLDGEGDQLEMTGSVPWVLGGAPDARLLTPADHEGRPVVLLVPVHAERTRLEQVSSSDPTRAFAHWSADAMPVAQTQVLARDDEAVALVAELKERVNLSLALDSLGVAKAALDLTLAYAKVREQFGAPIGSFQAVKHRSVDMFVHVQCAEVLLEEAVTRFGSGAAERCLRAKAAACEAAAEVTRSALQSHGAVGYTWEHPCHLLLRRAKLNQALGTPADEARRAVGASLTAALPKLPEGATAVDRLGSREGSNDQA
ncbi:Acyl-CoA dehydrogenase [Thermomonospora echinospora]|uniref:Acyl-CoA dehydrogenase n=1 Tax=Thermomonospora echinospora TaxID=1992 RepID=A0A1H6AMG9_9ACTN|nr:acyl-CoA dehydrogenase family protein [Thermomonospora echinospora]SEG49380.1 Acyl-CoA dehydrogenase [Thermomonospora echinospora]